MIIFRRVGQRRSQAMCFRSTLCKGFEVDEGSASIRENCAASSASEGAVLKPLEWWQAPSTVLILTSLYIYIYSFIFLSFFLTYFLFYSFFPIITISLLHTCV